MAHNLDTTNGTVSYVGAREDAWHHLGVTLPGRFTAEQAMAYGNLGGWNVRKTPVSTILEDGRYLPVPGRYATVRDNPLIPGQVDVLGSVGGSYTVIQNEAHADFLNALVDESGAHFETAGAIDGGRKVFVTMKVPTHINVGGVDRVESYIAAVNSHDGSTAFQVMVTPVRIVCQNTLNLALGNHSHSFRMAHRSGAANARVVQVARQALDLTFGYLDEFQAEAERLINTTMTQVTFEQMVQKAFGAPEDAAAQAITRAENKIAEMERLFADSVTHEGLRETAWAGLNALTEWADHYSPARGDSKSEVRAARALLDPAFKNRAFALVKETVGLA